MFHAYVQKFDVTGTIEIFLKLNRALKGLFSLGSQIAMPLPLTPPQNEGCRLVQPMRSATVFSQEETGSFIFLTKQPFRPSRKH